MSALHSARLADFEALTLCGAGRINWSPREKYLVDHADVLHRLARRCPPPLWSVEELGACFVVGDHNGQTLAYVYFEDEPDRHSAGKSERRQSAASVLYCDLHLTIASERNWKISCQHNSPSLQSIINDLSFA